MPSLSIATSVDDSRGGDPVEDVVGATTTPSHGDHDNGDGTCSGDDNGLIFLIPPMTLLDILAKVVTRITMQNAIQKHTKGSAEGQSSSDGNGGDSCDSEAALSTASVVRFLVAKAVVEVVEEHGRAEADDHNLSATAVSLVMEPATAQPTPRDYALLPPEAYQVVRGIPSLLRTYQRLAREHFGPLHRQFVNTVTNEIRHYAASREREQQTCTNDATKGDGEGPSPPVRSLMPQTVMAALPVAVEALRGMEATAPADYLLIAAMLTYGNERTATNDALYPALVDGLTAHKLSLRYAMPPHTALSSKATSSSSSYSPAPFLVAMEPTMLSVFIDRLLFRYPTGTVSAFLQSIVSSVEGRAVSSEEEEEDGEGENRQQQSEQQHSSRQQQIVADVRSVGLYLAKLFEHSQNIAASPSDVYVPITVTSEEGAHADDAYEEEGEGVDPTIAQAYRKRLGRVSAVNPMACLLHAAARHWCGPLGVMQLATLLLRSGVVPSSYAPLSEIDGSGGAAAVVPSQVVKGVFDLHLMSALTAKRDGPTLRLLGAGVHCAATWAFGGSGGVHSNTVGTSNNTMPMATLSHHQQQQRGNNRKGMHILAAIQQSEDDEANGTVGDVTNVSAITDSTTITYGGAASAGSRRDSQGHHHVPRPVVAIPRVKDPHGLLLAAWGGPALTTPVNHCLGNAAFAAEGTVSLSASAANTNHRQPINTARPTTADPFGESPVPASLPAAEGGGGQSASSSSSGAPQQQQQHDVPSQQSPAASHQNDVSPSPPPSLTLIQMERVAPPADNSISAGNGSAAPVVAPCQILPLLYNGANAEATFYRYGIRSDKSDALVVAARAPPLLVATMTAPLPSFAQRQQDGQTVESGAAFFLDGGIDDALLRAIAKCAITAHIDVPYAIPKTTAPPLVGRNTKGVRGRLSNYSSADRLGSGSDSPLFSGSHNGGGTRGAGGGASSHPSSSGSLRRPVVVGCGATTDDEALLGASSRHQHSATMVDPDGGGGTAANLEIYSDDNPNDAEEEEEEEGAADDDDAANSSDSHTTAASTPLMDRPIDTPRNQSPSWAGGLLVAAAHTAGTTAENAITTLGSVGTSASASNNNHRNTLLASSTVSNPTPASQSGAAAITTATVLDAADAHSSTSRPPPLQKSPADATRDANAEAVEHHAPLLEAAVVCGPPTHAQHTAREAEIAATAAVLADLAVRLYHLKRLHAEAHPFGDYVGDVNMKALNWSNEGVGTQPFDDYLRREFIPSLADGVVEGDGSDPNTAAEDEGVDPSATAMSHGGGGHGGGGGGVGGIAPPAPPPALANSSVVELRHTEYTAMMNSVAHGSVINNTMMTTMTNIASNACEASSPTYQQPIGAIGGPSTAASSAAASSTAMACCYNDRGVRMTTAEMMWVQRRDRLEAEARAREARRAANAANTNTQTKEEVVAVPPLATSSSLRRDSSSVDTAILTSRGSGDDLTVGKKKSSAHHPDLDADDHNSSVAGMNTTPRGGGDDKGGSRSPPSASLEGTLTIVHPNQLPMVITARRQGHGRRGEKKEKEDLSKGNRDGMDSTDDDDYEFDINDEDLKNRSTGGHTTPRPSTQLLSIAPNGPSVVHVVHGHANGGAGGTTATASSFHHHDAMSSGGNKPIPSSSSGAGASNTSAHNTEAPMTASTVDPEDSHSKSAAATAISGHHPHDDCGGHEVDADEEEEALPPYAERRPTLNTSQSNNNNAAAAAVGSQRGAGGNANARELIINSNSSNFSLNEDLLIGSTSAPKGGCVVMPPPAATTVANTTATATAANTTTERRRRDPAQRRVSIDVHSPLGSDHPQLQQQRAVGTASSGSGGGGGGIISLDTSQIIARSTTSSPLVHHNGKDAASHYNPQHGHHHHRSATATHNGGGYAGDAAPPMPQDGTGTANTTPMAQSLFVSTGAHGTAATGRAAKANGTAVVGGGGTVAAAARLRLGIAYGSSTSPASLAGDHLESTQRSTASNNPSISNNNGQSSGGGGGHHSSPFVIASPNNTVASPHTAPSSSFNGVAVTRCGVEVFESFPETNVRLGGLFELLLMGSANEKESESTNGNSKEVANQQHTTVVLGSNNNRAFSSSQSAGEREGRASLRPVSPAVATMGQSEFSHPLLLGGSSQAMDALVCVSPTSPLRVGAANNATTTNASASAAVAADTYFGHQSDVYGHHHTSSALYAPLSPTLLLQGQQGGGDASPHGSVMLMSPTSPSALAAHSYAHVTLGDKCLAVLRVWLLGRISESWRYYGSNASGGGGGRRQQTDTIGAIVNDTNKSAATASASLALLNSTLNPLTSAAQHAAAAPIDPRERLMLSLASVLSFLEAGQPLGDEERGNSHQRNGTNNNKREDGDANGSSVSLSSSLPSPELRKALTSVLLRVASVPSALMKHSAAAVGPVTSSTVPTTVPVLAVPCEMLPVAVRRAIGVEPSSSSSSSTQQRNNAMMMANTSQQRRYPRSGGLNANKDNVIGRAINLSPLLWPQSAVQSNFQRMSAVVHGTLQQIVEVPKEWRLGRSNKTSAARHDGSGSRTKEAGAGGGRTMKKKPFAAPHRTVPFTVPNETVQTAMDAHVDAADAAVIATFLSIAPPIGTETAVAANTAAAPAECNSHNPFETALRDWAFRCELPKDGRIINDRVTARDEWQTQAIAKAAASTGADDLTGSFANTTRMSEGKSMVTMMGTVTSTTTTSNGDRLVDATRTTTAMLTTPLTTTTTNRANGSGKKGATSSSSPSPSFSSSLDLIAYIRKNVQMSTAEGLLQWIEFIVALLVPPRARTSRLLNATATSFLSSSRMSEVPSTSFSPSASRAVALAKDLVHYAGQTVCLLHISSPSATEGGPANCPLIPLRSQQYQRRLSESAMMTMNAMYSAIGGGVGGGLPMSAIASASISSAIGFQSLSSQQQNGAAPAVGQGPSSAAASPTSAAAPAPQQRPTAYIPVRLHDRAFVAEAAKDLAHSWAVLKEGLAATLCEEEESEGGDEDDEAAPPRGPFKPSAVLTDMIALVVAQINCIQRGVYSEAVAVAMDLMALPGTLEEWLDDGVTNANALSTTTCANNCSGTMNSTSSTAADALSVAAAADGSTATTNANMSSYAAVAKAKANGGFDDTATSLRSNLLDAYRCEALSLKEEQRKSAEGGMTPFVGGGAVAEGKEGADPSCAAAVVGGSLSLLNHRKGLFEQTMKRPLRKGQWFEAKASEEASRERRAKIIGESARDTAMRVKWKVIAAVLEARQSTEALAEVLGAVSSRNSSTALVGGIPPTSMYGGAVAPPMLNTTMQSNTRVRVMSMDAVTAAMSAPAILKLLAAAAANATTAAAVLPACAATDGPAHHVSTTTILSPLSFVPSAPHHQQASLINNNTSAPAMGAGMGSSVHGGGSLLLSRTVPAPSTTHIASASQHQHHTMYSSYGSSPATALTAVAAVPRPVAAFVPIRVRSAAKQRVDGLCTLWSVNVASLQRRLEAAVGELERGGLVASPLAVSLAMEGRESVDAILALLKAVVAL